jgi:VCBS repeat-containing protein
MEVYFADAASHRQPASNEDQTGNTQSAATDDLALANDINLGSLDYLTRGLFNTDIAGSLFARGWWGDSGGSQNPVQPFGSGPSPITGAAFDGGGLAFHQELTSEATPLSSQSGPTGAGIPGSLAGVAGAEPVIPSTPDGSFLSPVAGQGTTVSPIVSAGTASNLSLSAAVIGPSGNSPAGSSLEELDVTGIPFSMTEGVLATDVTVATFTDPDGYGGTYTATIDWGDGGNSPGTITGGTVKGSHQYGAEGTYNVVVTVTEANEEADPDSQGTSFSTATVDDAPLTLTGTTIQTIEGQSFSGTVATLTDQGGLEPSNNYYVSIDWGDGGLPDVGSVNGSNVLGDHTYAEEGQYTIKVSIDDQGGATDSTTSTATVADAPLTVAGTGINATEGHLFDGTVATFTDHGGQESSDNYRITINWGDGSALDTQTGMVDASGISGSHTYAAEGTYAVSVTISDEGGQTGTATSTATVVEEVPVANDDAYSVVHDRILSENAPGVLANDIDEDGDGLRAVPVSGPTHGSLTLNSDGSFTYAPNVQYAGLDSFTYQAYDGPAGSNTATVTIDVTNNVPVANDDSYSVLHDRTLTVTAAGVLGNDTDEDNDSLTAVLVSSTSHGNLSLSSDGSFTYTPIPHYVGLDSFQYKANDGAADSNIATVTINVTNNAPVANDDGYSVLHDHTLSVDAAGVLGNDTDVDNDPLTAVWVSGPSHGNLSLNSDGSFTYTPNPHYAGLDTFQYKANDGIVDSNIATVTINVTNNIPVANNDSYGVHPNTPLTVAAPGVLANDTDADGDPLTANWVSGPSHGMLTLNSDGSFTYTSDNNYTGTDSFTYQANDGVTNSNTATVTLTIHSTNQPPVANDDSYNVIHDRTLTVAAPGVLANDTDPDGDPLTAVWVSGPSHGNLSLNSDGSFTYTPNTHYVGPDSFTYYANDGLANSNTATVSITVTDQAPVVTNPGNQTNEDGDVVSWPIAASDPDNDALTFSATGLPPGLGIDSNSGVIAGTIASTADSGSPYSVTVAASDGILSASQTFTWTVGHIFLSNPGDQNNAVGDAVLVALTAHDSDGDPLTYSASGLPAGLAIDSSTGEISGTIASTADGGSPYTVTVSASDGPHSASQTFTWTVSHVFVVNPGEQRNATGDVVLLPINAGDNDGESVTYTATNLPAGLIIDSSTGMISGTIATQAAGGSPYHVTVSAADPAGHGASQMFDWTVSRVVVTNPGDQSNFDSDQVSLAIAATDHDHPSLFYSATGLPAGLSLNSSSGVITGWIAPTADANSPYRVTVSATDGTSTDQQTFTWTVTNPITIVNPGDQKNAVGDMVSLPVQASEARQRPLMYSANGLPPGLTINSSSGVIAGTISASADTGSPYTVTVTATQGVNSANQSFIWKVSHVVVTNPGDQNNAVGDVVALPIVAKDNDGDRLIYAATGLPAGLGINNSSGLISGTIAPMADAGSPYTVTVTATDPNNHSDQQTFTWTVSHVLLTDPGDQNSAAGDMVALQLSGKDNDGDQLTYSATGLPPGLSIANNGLISGTLPNTAPNGSPYLVTVKATDATNQADTKTFLWTVTTLRLLNPGPQRNATGDTVDLQIQATGPQGVPFQYNASGLPSNLNMNVNTGRITGSISPTAESSSPFTVTVSVSDGRGVTAQEFFTWTIAHILLDNPGDQTYAVGEQVELQISAKDNDGHPLTYSATGLPPGLGIGSGSGLILGTIPATALSGSPYNVTVQATDGMGITATVAFAMNVQDYKVTFEPSPVITGFVFEKEMNTNVIKLKSLEQQVTAKVTDKTKIDNVTIALTGQKDRVALGQLSKDPNTGNITFDVLGKSATPNDKKDGDTTLEAQDKTTMNKKKGTVQVIVVIPKSIAKQNKPFSAVSSGFNLVMNKNSRPPWPEQSPDKSFLATVYGAYDQIQVLDQFGKPLHKIYEGSPVFENLGADKTFISINQKVDENGLYKDFIGTALRAQRQGKVVEVPENSKEARNWETKAAKLRLEKKLSDPVPMDTGVQVGGHKLEPAIVRRVRTFTPLAGGKVAIDETRN